MGARRVLRHSAWICWKDLLEFGRSKMRLVMLVLMPLFMMVMVGYIFPSGTTISNQPVALANQDAGITLVLPPANTSQTMNLGSLFVTELQAVNNETGMMDLRPSSGFDDIKNQIQDGGINGGIIIPADFSQCLMSGEQGNITIVTDQSNPQMSAMMETVLSQTIGAMGKQLAMYNLNQNFHISISKANAMIQPYNIQFTGIVPGHQNYFEFIAPGITTMVVMMSLMTGLDRKSVV
jgi:hypothetical protein